MSDLKPTVKERAEVAKALVEARAAGKHMIKLIPPDKMDNPTRRQITATCKKYGITRKQFRKLYIKGKRNAKEVQETQQPGS